MNNSEKPERLLRLLRTFCPPDLVEEIEGDLLQRYEREIKSGHSQRKANRRLLWNTLRFFRPGILLRNKLKLEQNQLPMLRNYFLTSLRHIRKSKVNFAFKIGGLSLAIFSFLAIATYVGFQLSFDTFHTDYQNIYRVNSQRKENGAIEQYAIVPYGVGPILKEQVPEVTSLARVRYANKTYLRLDKNLFSCKNTLEADSTLFDVLTFEFIHGDRKALRKPNSIVLTRTIAMRVFGTTDVLQKTLSINNDPTIYEVTAVIEDTRPNSHIFLSALIPIHEQEEFSATSISDPVMYIDRAATLLVRLSQPVDQNLMDNVHAAIDPYVDKAVRTEYGFDLSFQPIADVYLGPKYKADYFDQGSSIYVYAFSVLGILLLVVAGINYVNLCIADFSNRMRETGVRKVMGARKYQLIIQVTIDTVVFGVIALALATGSLYIIFPKLAGLLDSSLQFDMLLSPGVLMLAVPGLLAVLLFSTYFPARQFASTSVIQNLKSKTSGYNSSLSQFLLATQFTISAICICCTLIVGSQIDFMHNKELGFNKKDLLVLSMPSEFTVRNMQTFKQELRQLPGVTGVSNSSFRIGGGYWKDWYFVEQEDTHEMKHMELFEVFSDDALFSTLGIQLKAGRLFDANIPSDSGAAFVMNESAVRELGWTNPIGKRIYTHPEEKGKWDGTVVGVVSDINISPLYEKVKPLVMRLPWTNEYPDNFVYVRYEGDFQAVLKSVEALHKNIIPGYPFHYRLVDELYESYHQKETKAFASLQFGTFVIVLVSALGIFSMAAYMSIKRMKEFGIRKVLGASQSQIVGLHLSFFARLTLVANCIALPLSYWLIKEWLDTFAYRIELTTLPFLITAVVSIALVIFSGSYQAWKAGSMNPVDVIKTE